MNTDETMSMYVEDSEVGNMENRLDEEVSEDDLVWAAYYNQGIDIEGNIFFDMPEVVPIEIRNSDNVMKIEYK